MRSGRTYPILLLLILACSSPKDPGDAEQGPSREVDRPLEWMDKVFTQQELFSIYIGKDLEDFKSGYAPTEIIKDEQYSFDGTLENGLPFTFYVSANEDRIFEMNMDLFPERTALKTLFDDLLAHLDSLYGISRPTDGFATWRRASLDGNLVEVTLSDESIEMGKPTLTVNQLELEGRKYEE